MLDNKKLNKQKFLYFRINPRIKGFRESLKTRGLTYLLKKDAMQFFMAIFHQACGAIDRKCRHLLNQQENVAGGKSWCRLITSRLPMVLPRHVFVAYVRILTGHTYFQYFISIINSPNCTLCSGQTMTFTHLISCISMANYNLPRYIFFRAGL